MDVFQVIPFQPWAFGERNEKRGMLLSEDAGVIKLFTVSKNVETMRLAASPGGLRAANCLQLRCRRTDRLLGFGRAPLRPACARSPRIPSPSPPQRLVRVCGGRTGQSAEGSASALNCSAPPTRLSLLVIVAAIVQLPKN